MTSHLCLVSAAEASWGPLQTSHVSQGLVTWCAHQHGALFQGWMGRSGRSPSVDSTWTRGFWTWRDFLSINAENGHLEIVHCMKDVGHPLVLIYSFSYTATASTVWTAIYISHISSLHWERWATKKGLLRPSLLAVGQANFKLYYKISSHYLLGSLI